MLILILILITAPLISLNKDACDTANQLHKNICNTMQMQKEGTFLSALELIKSSLESQAYLEAAYYITFTVKYKMPNAAELCIKALKENIENLETAEDVKIVDRIINNFTSIINHKSLSEDFFEIVLLLETYISSCGYAFTAQDEAEIKITKIPVYDIKTHKTNKREQRRSSDSESTKNESAASKERPRELDENPDISERPRKKPAKSSNYTKWQGKKG